MSRLLITGALGQIGSEISLHLKQIFGRDSVIISDLRESSNPGNDGNFRKLDVTDISSLERIVKEEGITEIFHLAAVLSAAGERMPELAYEVNSIGTFNILRVSRKLGIRKVMIPSSIAVYGPDTPREHTPVITITRPDSIYGITKVENEMLSSYYWKKFGLDVRGIRFPGLLSYRTPPTAGTTDYAVEMIKSASLGEPYTCYLSPDRRLPMMYMPDAINSLMDLFNADRKNLRFCTEYNIAAFSFSPSDLENKLKERFSDFKVSYKVDYRDAIAKGWPSSLDASDAEKDWGFRARYSLSDMIDDMVKNFQNPAVN